jgi:hypothetical protein
VRKTFDTTTDLGEGDNAQMEMILVRSSDPGGNTGIGCRLDQLGDDVGVEEIAVQTSTSRG